MKSTKQRQEFIALELRISDDATAPHTVYFKDHSVREQSNEKPSGRTLFVVNVPPYADEQGLKNSFSEAGTVTSVIFSEKPSATITKTSTFLPEPTKTSFKVAYVVFSKVSELENALKLTSLRPMNSNGHEILTGLNKWVEEYNNAVWPQKVLKERIEEFMKNHDKETKKAEEKDKKLAEEDDDGWITVTKKGKVNSFARTEKVENKILAKEEIGKKRKELKNFYTFQIRESKMKHIVALRQKFEEDKKKIAQIKQSRRFKPF